MFRESRRGTSSEEPIGPASTKTGVAFVYGTGNQYTLKDLRPIDQSRMGLLHRQADAVALP